MSTPKLARHIAKRLESNADATAQNAAKALRELADQVETLTHALELTHARSAQIATERDEFKHEVAQWRAKHHERRTRPRA